MVRSRRYGIEVCSCAMLVLQLEHKVTQGLATRRFSSICQIPALSCRLALQSPRLLYSLSLDNGGLPFRYQVYKRCKKWEKHGKTHTWPRACPFDGTGKHTHKNSWHCPQCIESLEPNRSWCQCPKLPNHNQSRRMQPWSSFIWWLAILQRTCGEENVLDAFLHTCICGPMPLV